ncbi:branched-chain amino acid ABC transporter permease [Haloquadratum walsbyi]|uniref:ABC-type transport system permease protein (Probable substrate branched-chain amino acids) n=1 Tax=Haloquadratum walsbyi (strain DSM 16854 / JCM 12705 / C23) TaxID=768065 RepID=G0LGV9_HALWC|nr:branched-chain amino acid ABC transporter permease [Haloquadratum walsbyi]CCC39661.1 ABC-type transport system permease protein (probable substrate branched-chain amino acids) [Haloquadratum walsbyi C23]
MSDPDATSSDGATVVDDPQAPSLVERLQQFREREATVIGLTAIGVALFPWIFARAPVISDLLLGYQNLAALMLIWAIFAIGFDLLLGYTGLLSFGHAAFWGGGAYVAGIVSLRVSSDPIVMVAAGTIFAVLFAWVLGYLSLRRGGIYFSILTLAFAQMLYYMSAAPLASLTGGENGLTGIDVSPLFGSFHLESELPMLAGELLGTWMYAFVGVITVAAVGIAYRILNSPYGMVFRAIRENEQRAKFVGLNVWRYKLMAFIVSAGFAGIAGSLFTIHGSYVPLQSLFWTESGEIVIMVVLGGTASLFGPILGAGLYLYIENIVSGIQQLQVPFTDIVLINDFGTYWHLLLGLIFVVVIWTAPRGLWGGLSDLRIAVESRLRGEDR